MTTNTRTLISHLIEAVFFIVIIASIWGYFNNKLDVSEQNLKAAQGQIEQVELKNGELLTSRDSYIAKIGDLEELLDISKNEAKEIQRQLDSKIAYISKLESEVRVEHIETVRDSIIYINGTDEISALFSFRDEWLSLNGENIIRLGENFDCQTNINNLQMSVPLNVGLTNDYQIFVKTPNPYVSFSSIDGAVIDNSVLKPRKKRFSWGLHGGIGVMYDIIDNDIAVGPTASFGVHINF